MPEILVIGSTNTDMVVKSERLPKPGETVIGGTFLMNPGGKGANQAVAAARLGGNVVFITKVGNDIFGEKAIAGFREEGISTDAVFTDPANPSGVALITVDSKGENCISVASGANSNLTIEDIKQADRFVRQAEIILLQLEIPFETNEYILELGKKLHIKIILNPAPAHPLVDKLLKGSYLITPNETEAEMITGQKVTDFETADLAAGILLAKGVQHVAITMGASGVFYKSGDKKIMLPAPKVKAKDTTAAGDVFNGAIAVGLGEDLQMEKAIEFAIKAASLSVTRMGAQNSAPYRREMKDI